MNKIYKFKINLLKIFYPQNINYVILNIKQYIEI